MTSMTDKARDSKRGDWQREAGGRKVAGSEKTEAEGRTQEAKGHAQKTVGDAKDAVKHGADKAADAEEASLTPRG